MKRYIISLVSIDPQVSNVIKLKIGFLKRANERRKRKQFNQSGMFLTLTLETAWVTASRAM